MQDMALFSIALIIDSFDAGDGKIKIKFKKKTWETQRNFIEIIVFEPSVQFNTY